VNETEVASRIRASLDACVRSGVPGAMVAVDAPGLAVSVSTGLFSQDDSRLLRATDAFRAASVTKAVTAASAVRLAARGFWSLDESAEKRTRTSTGLPPLEPEATQVTA